MSETVELLQESTDEQRGWVRRVLGVRFPDTEDPEAPPVRAVSLVEFAKLRLEWESAKKAVAGDLARLRGVIEAEYAGDPIVSAASRLDTILERFNDGLGDRLDDLANAADPVARRTAAQAAQSITEDYRAYVMEDPLVDLIEINPFETILISGRLGDVLGRVSDTLARAGG